VVFNTAFFACSEGFGRSFTGAAHCFSSFPRWNNRYVFFYPVNTAFSFPFFPGQLSDLIPGSMTGSPFQEEGHSSFFRGSCFFFPPGRIFRLAQCGVSRLWRSFGSPSFPGIDAGTRSSQELGVLVSSSPAQFFFFPYLVWSCRPFFLAEVSLL